MSGDWLDVAPVAAVDATTPLVVDVDGVAVLIARCGAEYFAVEDRCTHDGSSFDGAPAEDCELVCPRHGARFCLRTGAALSPPAYEPLRTYRVRVADGRLLVERPA